MLQSRQQNGDLEPAACLPQKLGEHELPPVHLEPPQPPREHIARQDADADAVGPKPFRQHGIRLSPVEAQVLRHRFCRAVHLVDVVPAVVEPQAYILHGAGAFLQHLHLVPVDEGIVPRLTAQDYPPVALVQTDERAGHSRCRMERLLDLRAGDMRGFQRRILQRCRQVGRKLRIMARGEFGDVQVEHFGESHEQPRAGRTLVGFDERDVARAHAELFGHLRLCKPEVLAQRLQPGADDELFASRHYLQTLQNPRFSHDTTDNTTSFTQVTMHLMLRVRHYITNMT